MSNRHRTAAESEFGRLMEGLLKGTEYQPGASGGRSIDVSLWFPKEKALRFEVKTSTSPRRPLKPKERVQLEEYRRSFRLHGISTFYAFKHIAGVNTTWRIYDLKLPKTKNGIPELRADAGTDVIEFAAGFQDWLLR